MIALGNDIFYDSNLLRLKKIMFACCSSTPSSSSIPTPTPNPAHELWSVMDLTAPVEPILATCETLALAKLDEVSLADVWHALFHAQTATTLIEAFQWQQLHCSYWTLLARACPHAHGEAVRAPLDSIYAWRTQQKLGPFGEAAATFPTDDQWARMYLWIVHDIPLLLQQERPKP